MRTTESVDEKELWEQLCADPKYPCAVCTACENPQQCNSKKCIRWQVWWGMRFEKFKERVKISEIKDSGEKTYTLEEVKSEVFGREADD